MKSYAEIELTEQQAAKFGGTFEAGDVIEVSLDIELESESFYSEAWGAGAVTKHSSIGIIANYQGKEVELTPKQERGIIERLKL